jgi:hypothetical protein
VSIAANSSATRRVADAGNADERHQLRRALLAGAHECTDQLLDLALTPYERDARARREVDAEARPRLHDLPDREGLLLALRLDRALLAEVDRLRRRAVGGLANEDAVRRGG